MSPPDCDNDNQELTNFSFSDRNLLLPKALYFSLNLLLYSTYTFTASYFEDAWNIPPHHFGYIVGLCALSFTGSVFWTMIADKTGRHKSIILFTTVGYTVTFCLLRTNAFIHASLHTRILFVATCFGVANFFTSALYPLLDNQVFIQLSTDKRFSKELFGRQRLFGVIGQSVITVINGAMTEKLGYDAMFFNLLASSIIFITLVVIGIPSFSKSLTTIKQNPIKEKETSNDPPQIIQTDNVTKLPFRSAIRKLVTSFDYLFFMFIVLISGTTRGVAGNFLPQYLKGSMRLSPLDISILLQSRLVTEIAVFFLGRQMLQAMGINWMLFLAQFTGFLRVFAYSILPTTCPWTMAPFAVELLKGINNACLISAGIRYVHDFSPVGVEATAQGIFSGVNSYLANSASGFFGGFLLEINSSSTRPYQLLFTYTSVLSAIGIILYILKHLFFGHVRPINSIS